MKRRKAKNQEKQKTTINPLSSLPRLPRDIILDILTRLPAKSIARFKCVRKSWRYVFDDMQFCKLHYDNQKKTSLIKIIVSKGTVLYSVDAYDSVLSEAVKMVDYPFYEDMNQHTADSILGSCNGIVCIRPQPDIICFWNPSTKEHKIVPEPPTQREVHWIRYKYGFGYDLKNQDYKLVRFQCGIGSQIMVYSLASNSWSTAPCTMPHTVSRDVRPASVYFNGALHWLTRCRSKALISFDLGDEIIREVPGPDSNKRFYYEKFVDVLGGDLCITCIRPGVPGVVWVMKEYGVGESWTKLFTIPQRAIDFVHFRPIEYIHNRKQVLLSVQCKKYFRYVSNVLFCYNPRNKKARVLKIGGSDLKWLSANTYEESLFSILRKQKSDGIRHFLDDDQFEQEKALPCCSINEEEDTLPKHDYKRRKKDRKMHVYNI